MAKPARKKRVSRKSARPSIPDRLFAHASPVSAGGVSLFDAQSRIRAETVTNFASDPSVMAKAVQALQQSGFEILQVSPYTINIAAPISTYQKAFNTKIEPLELPVIKEGAVKDTATFFDSPDTAIRGLIATDQTEFRGLLEGVAIEEPVYFMTASPYAPTKSYWHLDVPAGVSLGTNADKAHRGGITGRGIRVAMVDSGHFRHPYFDARGYRIAPVTLGPATANPLVDDNGHGTAESANIFAVAPDVELLPVKVNFTNSLGAFNAAVGLNPDIITCSWGSSVRTGPLSAINQALAAAIADAVARGIIVVFSAGNGHFGFPGQHPDVISAGGVFMGPDGSLRASDYASGFASGVYAGRNVPDLCGLVGMQPRAAYIMLPLQEGCAIDVDLAGGTHPNADETASNDGWAAISGTSAAAPQLAGASALVKQACSRLTPGQVRDILIRTARDVTTGNCNPATGGNPAGPGSDLATGAGLVDAHRAALMAKVRCLGPIRPIVPVLPIEPVRPVTPIGPITPVTPVIPVTPVLPVRPIVPVTPVGPVQPISPIVNPPPLVPTGEMAPAAPGGEAQPSATQLSAEDIQALDDLISKSDLEL